jgi:hypothetical protein
LDRHANHTAVDIGAVNPLGQEAIFFDCLHRGLADAEPWSDTVQLTSARPEVWVDMALRGKTLAMIDDDGRSAKTGSNVCGAPGSGSFAKGLASSL